MITPTISRKSDTTFLYLGENPPDMPGVKAYPRVDPKAHLLYDARVKATLEVNTEFFCWLDGDGDDLPEDFLQRIEESKEIIRSTGGGLVYGDEIESGELVKRGPWEENSFKTKPQEIHHAVLVRTSAAHSITYPKGCYWYEGVCYWQVAKHFGSHYLPGVHYVWTPSKNGARLWADTARGIINSMLHMSDHPGVHIKGEK